MPSTDALVLSLVEFDWTMPPQLQEQYEVMRREATAHGDTAAVLAAVDELVRDSADPVVADLGDKVADARHAVSATSSSEWYISAPSTTPGVEGRQHAQIQSELRRKVFRVGPAAAEVLSDGTVVIRHREGTSTTYLPVTAAEYEDFLDGNRRTMEAVATLGAKVRSLLMSDRSLPRASRGTTESGVDVHVGGGHISIYWWSATLAEQLRLESASSTPWSEPGGHRDQVADLLSGAGIQTRADADTLLVVCP